jgi:hypothetical protein
MVKVINLQSSEEQVDETNPVFSEEVKLVQSNTVDTT